MPSTSKKQHNLMAAVANNPSFAKKKGIPQSVGAEFMKADKGRKFKQGGAMDMAQDKKLVKKAVKMHDQQLHGGKKTNLTKLRKGGSCAAYKKGGKVRYNDGGMPDYETREETPEEKAQFGAAVAQYKVDKGMNPNIDDDMTFKEAFAAARKEGDKKFTWRGKSYSTELAKPKATFADKAKKAGFTSAETKGGAALMTRKDRSTGMKAGGSVRGNGCAIKGKTKGRMV